ncbi:hypothetical protein G7Z17_g11982 [Cylindrodendrum hubeiense]|uniref:Uncharacterized protein n=1 Tax=Cylindrodendrum hubeiense TaxID=595255 RepID=A0A9P5L9Q3_9HYPO|nr:hypothetical protein G7Z17_g11982 [Cylindrodendrum hubeiense]
MSNISCSNRHFSEPSNREDSPDPNQKRTIFMWEGSNMLESNHRDDGAESDSDDSLRMAFNKNNDDKTKAILIEGSQSGEEKMDDENDQGDKEIKQTNQEQISPNSTIDSNCAPAVTNTPGPSNNTRVSHVANALIHRSTPTVEKTAAQNQSHPAVVPYSRAYMAMVQAHDAFFVATGDVERSRRVHRHAEEMLTLRENELAAAADFVSQMEENKLSDH